MRISCLVTGILLVMGAQQLPCPEAGLALALAFLGGCLCLGALQGLLAPLLEALLAASDQAHIERLQLQVKKRYAALSEALDGAIQDSKGKRS